MNALVRKAMFALGLWFVGIGFILTLVLCVERMGVEVPTLIQGFAAGAWGWFVGWATAEREWR